MASSAGSAPDDEPEAEEPDADGVDGAALMEGLPPQMAEILKSQGVNMEDFADPAKLEEMMGGAGGEEALAKMMEAMGAGGEGGEDTFMEGPSSTTTILG